MRVILCLLFLLPGIAHAQKSARLPASDPSGLCETAVASAEYVSKLPLRLLGAISLAESGRLDRAKGVMRPWPWSISAEGEGQFFATRQDAIAAVRALQGRGVQSVDVGCMQVNLMSHPQAFHSLDDAFDPRSNALYAARFLNALYQQSKDWSQAIGAYHSETPALSKAYRVLVLARWQNPDLRDTAPPRSAYRDFAQDDQVYSAFAPAVRVYGAFAQGNPSH